MYISIWSFHFVMQRCCNKSETPGIDTPPLSASAMDPRFFMEKGQRSKFFYDQEQPGIPVVCQKISSCRWTHRKGTGGENPPSYKWAGYHPMNYRQITNKNQSVNLDLYKQQLIAIYRTNGAPACRIFIHRLAVGVHSFDTNYGENRICITKQLAPSLHVTKMLEV